MKGKGALYDVGEKRNPHQLSFPHDPKCVLVATPTSQAFAKDNSRSSAESRGHQQATGNTLVLPKAS